MAQIEVGDYISGTAGRGYIGLFNQGRILNSGDKFKGEAGKDKLILVKAKAANASIFQPTPVLSFFYVGQRVAEQTLKANDEGIEFTVTKDWPLVSGSIELTRETQEVLSQIDAGIPKQIPTGKETSEISLTVMLRKQDKIIEAFQTMNMDVVTTAADGSVTHTRNTNTKFVLFLKDLDGQTDQDSGVVCLVEPSKKLYTFDITTVAQLEVPMSLASGANMTLVKINKA